MAIQLSPLYDDLDFLSPLSNQRAKKLNEFLSNNAEGTIIDIGCGWATLLIQLLKSNSSLSGWGIDLNEDAISHGQSIAKECGISDRITLICGDAKVNSPEKANGVICIGASQIWGHPVEDNSPLDYKSALTSLRQLVQPGSPVIYGEGIWISNPTPAATNPLSGRDDEFIFLPELLDIAHGCGFVVMDAHQATLDEWDQFEFGCTAAYSRWLVEHDNDHPDADEVRSRLASKRDAYLRGYRNTLGMAYLELFAT